MPPDATPQNGGYMVAAYIITAVVYSVYTISLWMRARNALKEED